MIDLLKIDIKEPQRSVLNDLTLVFKNILACFI